MKPVTVVLCPPQRLARGPVRV